MPDGGASIWLPILIGGVTATATTAVGAYASGKAADTQAAAGERALQVEQGMYRDAVARTTPYIQNGTAANNALAKLMGLSGAGPLAAPPAAAPPGSPGEAPVIDVRNPETRDDSGSPAGGWNPLTTLMSAQPALTSGGSPFGPPTAGKPAADAGSMVMMVSPDGADRKAVPRDQVAFYQRRGAVIAPATAADRSEAA